jgi:hypothetical protein
MRAAKATRMPHCVRALASSWREHPQHPSFFKYPCSTAARQARNAADAAL